MSFVIPVRRLRETHWLMAFHHPRPSYPVHILIVPKRAIASLVELTPAEAELMVEVVLVARSLVEELGLAETGYRLIVNGGKFQEVAQLHFHLIAEK